ncbi:MAG: hypothetical protein EPGJADBJ_04088 [Saprospiraceae bacterium]|nr:hypothetical protein [Saprospiraceae bacterium]
MITFLGLRTCIYRVPDLAAATEWYTQVLGFQPYFNQPFYVGFEVGGYELGLQPYETPASAEATADKENIETYWGVDDIQATFAHMIELGATTKMKPTNVGEDIWVATVKDPWGNIFGMIKNPHFAPTDISHR